MSACSKNCKDCPAWPKSPFSHLNEKDLAALSQHKTAREFHRGDVFSEQGAPAESIYCLGAGSAKVILSAPGGGRQSIVRIVTPGDMLGYRCVFSEKTFRATASALVDSTACVIDKSVFMELIRSNPDFSMEILKSMGRELSAAEYHHHGFCQKNVRERLAEALLILKDKCGVPTESGWKLEIRLTRSELASWIGAAVETTIRGLTEFKEEGLIKDEQESLILLNLEKLNHVAGARP